MGDVIELFGVPDDMISDEQSKVVMKMMDMRNRMDSEEGIEPQTPIVQLLILSNFLSKNRGVILEDDYAVLMGLGVELLRGVNLPGFSGAE